MQKRELRQIMTVKAAMLPPDYIDTANAAIFERIVSLPEFITARTLFTYVSCAREPDTLRLIRFALDNGKKVYVPRIVGAGIMEATRIDGLGSLVPDRYGILSPGPGETVPPAMIDFSLIPCVCADVRGGRLGHGGGYYDRFFAAANLHEGAAAPNAAVLCYEALLSAELPAEAHDVRFGIVVTEKRTIRESDA